MFFGGVLLGGDRSAGASDNEEKGQTEEREGTAEQGTRRHPLRIAKACGIPHIFQPNSVESLRAGPRCRFSWARLPEASDSRVACGRPLQSKDD